jgi:hypothetical protein
MYSRISSVLMLAGLAGCSAQSEPASQAAATTPVSCALAEATTSTSERNAERSSADGKPILVIRHPDGGFRRLAVLDGGRRFAAADGSDPAEAVTNGQEIEVTVGQDHYLLPTPAQASADHAPRP